MRLVKTDQTGRMPRLICVFAGCTCQYVGFVTRRLIYVLYGTEHYREVLPPELLDTNTIYERAEQEEAGAEGSDVFCVNFTCPCT